MKKILLYVLIILSFQFSQLVSVNAQSPNPTVSPKSHRLSKPTPIPIPTNLPRAACRIEVDNAHLSTYSAEYKGKRTMKIVARSICNVPQSQVQLILRIYKVGFFTDHLLRTISTDPLSPKSSGLVVTIRDGEIECKDTKETKYYGKASSTAFINGVEEVARDVRSEKNLPVPCGT